MTKPDCDSFFLKKILTQGLLVPIMQSCCMVKGNSLCVTLHQIPVFAH